jgi:2-phospho-L-lactate guanylyltransferase
MHERPIVAIPIRSFDGAKTRLAGVLAEPQRSELGRALAARTAWIARDAGADVVIVAGTDAVAAWSDAAGFASILQARDAPGLDRAAFIGIDAAETRRRRGFVLHADLPWLTAAVMRWVLRIDGPVVAPSHDGGTSLIGGVDGSFPFAYGPASFHRHLAAVPQATVVIDSSLALDLDRPADLVRAQRGTGGRWMQRYTARTQDRTESPTAPTMPLDRRPTTED